MKSLKTLVALVMIANALGAVTARAERETHGLPPPERETHGGVDIRAQFKEARDRFCAAWESDWLEGFPADQRVTREQFCERVAKINVEPSEGHLDENVVARNYPEDNLIVVDQTMWLPYDYDVTKRYTLILHEYLSFFGIDRNYEVTSVMLRKLINEHRGSYTIATSLELAGFLAQGVANAESQHAPVDTSIDVMGVECKADVCSFKVDYTVSHVEEKAAQSVERKSPAASAVRWEGKLQEREVRRSVIFRAECSLSGIAKTMDLMELDFRGGVAGGFMLKLEHRNSLSGCVHSFANLVAAEVTRAGKR